MSKSTISAALLALSGILLTVCCFLPFKILTSTIGSERIRESIKFMPSLGGFLLVGLGVGCAIVAIAGYKQVAALLGTITAVLTAALMWYMSVSADSTAKMSDSVTGMMSQMFDEPVSVATTTTVESGIGFYLMIIAAILVIFSGFFYTLVDEN